MSLRENESVAICLVRISRIYIHHIEIKRNQYIRYRQRSARMSRFGSMYALKSVYSDAAGDFIQFLYSFQKNSSVN